MSAGPTRTQEAVLTAYVDLVEELGTDDVSYRLLARRAGVGERTVYRSYPSRADLLQAAAAWVEERSFARTATTSVFDVPLDVRESMRAYDARPELAHVVAEAAVREERSAQPGGPEEPRGHGNADRDAQVAALVERELPGLSGDDRRGLAAALTFVDSATTWVVLRRELGPDGRDIADAAAWTGEVLLQPARSHPA